MADEKLSIQEHLTALENRWQSEGSCPSLIIITYLTNHQLLAFKELKAKLHEKDTLLVGCNIYLRQQVAEVCGRESIVLISEDIPLGFIDSIGPFRAMKLSIEELQKLKSKHEKELQEQDFTMFQRDNGFLQVGDTVWTFKGNRWNAFNTFPNFSLPSIDGGNFVHNDHNILITMSTGDDMWKNQIEHSLRRQQLFPCFNFTCMLTLPNLGNIFGMAHADLCALWLNDNTICISQFMNLPYMKHNSKIYKLFTAFARDCSEILSYVVNIAKIPCLGVTTNSSEDGRGLYAQALVTKNAIYIPQYGQKIDENTAKSMLARVKDEELKTYESSDQAAKSAYEVAESKYGSGRPIIPIDSALLSCRSRGGLHCLTTQLCGKPALTLVRDLKEQGAKIDKSDEGTYVTI